MKPSLLFLFGFSFLVSSIVFTGCSSSSAEEEKLPYHARVIATGINVLVERNDDLKKYSVGDTVMLINNGGRWFIGAYAGKDLDYDFDHNKECRRAILLGEDPPALVKIISTGQKVVVQDEKIALLEEGDNVIILQKNNQKERLAVSNAIFSRDTVVYMGDFDLIYSLGVIEKKY